MEDEIIIICMCVFMVLIIEYWELTRGNFPKIIERYRTMLYTKKGNYK